MARVDYKMTSDYDKLIVNGDFAVGDSDEENVDLLLQLSNGHIRHQVLTGVNSPLYINSNLDFSYKQKIMTELLNDGYNVDLIYRNSDGEMEIDFS